MLEQQLAASKKETMALRQRLAAANTAMSAANINPANPALLRVMQEGGVKGGPHRGAGGTPHALALAWAREEAARLSPASVQVRDDSIDAFPSCACIVANRIQDCIAQGPTNHTQCSTICVCIISYQNFPLSSGKA